MTSKGLFLDMFNKKANTLLLLISLHFGATMLWGRSQPEPVSHFPYKQYTVLDGLTQTLTKRLLMDQRGFIWVGTKRGINRYDGLQFENYLNNAVFQDADIFDICEDDEGDIWFSSSKGLFNYDWDTLHNLLPDTPSEFEPFSMTIDPAKKIAWVINHRDSRELYRVEEGNIENLTIKIPELFKQKTHSIFFNQQENKLYVTTSDSLRSIGNIWCVEDNNIRFIDHYDRTLRTIFKADQNGNTFLSIADEIFKIENEHLKPIFEFDFLINAFDFRNGELIVASRTKLYKINDGKLIDFDLDLNFVYDLMVDDRGKIWIATEDGLFKIISEAFINYPQKSGMIKYPWSVLQDDEGAMWFASYGFGMARLKDGKYSYPKDYLSVYDENWFYTRAIKRGNGDLLFPTNQNVLVYSDGKYEILKGSQGRPVLSIYEDAVNDLIYLATNGLKKLDKNGLVAFYGDESGLDTETFKFLEDIEKDKNGNFWLTSDDGMARFDGENFINYYAGKEVKSGAMSIYKDYRENLWFGGRDGLMLLDYSAAVPVPVLESQIKGNIHFVIAVDSSYLILGQDRNLVLLDLQKYYNGEISIQVFDQENGFDGYECSQNGVFVDHEKSVWMLTANMVTRLFPNRIKKDTSTLRVFLTDFKSVNGESSVERAENLFIAGKDALLEIPSNEKNINFRFIAPNFSGPSKIKYQYKLEGFDDWSVPSPNRSVIYSKLPVGNYEFQVRASIRDGIYSKIARAKLSVLPATFWDQPMAVNFIELFPYLLAVSSILFLIWFLQRRRWKERTRDSKIEHEFTKLQINTLQNQINPHFFFNSLNAINALVIDGKKKDVLNYNQLLSDVIRPIFKSEKGVMRKLSEEIELVRKYVQLEELRFNNKFKSQITIDENVNVNALVPKTVIQTFVNNAIKHGLEPKREGGVLNISISQKEEKIEIMVEDNGIGRKASETLAVKNKKISTKRGVVIINQIIDLLNSQYPQKASVEYVDLDEENPNFTGTKVITRLYSKYKTI